MATLAPFVPKVAAPDAFAGRSAPYSAEAELAVLGGMLLEGDAVTKAIEVVDDSMFYREGNRRAFRAMVRIFQRGDVIDPVTLAEELRGAGDLEAVGGLQFIASVMDAVPTAANIEYHAKIVREKAVLRRLIEASTVTIQETYAHQGDIDELLDQAESRIFQIAQTHERKGFVWIKELLWPAMERIELLSQNSSAVTGVPTGFVDLDEMTAGFQKGDLIIVAARPSMGKCLSHDAEIVLEDGSVATIEQICERRHARLLTLGEDWKLGITEPSAFVDDGEKPVFRVTTRLGRQIETTLTHPFLTVDGWKPLGEIAVGQHVAVPRRIPVEGTAEMQECEVTLLAYLIGDGGLTGTNPRFTSADPHVRDDFAGAVAAFGGVTATTEDSRGARTPTLNVRRDSVATAAARAALSATIADALPRQRGDGARVAAAVGVSRGSVSHWARGRHVPRAAERRALSAALCVEFDTDGRTERNPLTAWLEGQGLWGKGVAEKTVPASVFPLRRDLLALFLNRLFATDGWATVLASGQAQVGYATVSERLARQVQHLLLRFGIVASLRRRRVKYAGGRRQAWQLDVTDARSLRTFVREIGIFGKETAVARVERALEEKRYQTNRDLVPREIGTRIAERKGDESWASLARRAGIRGSTNIHVGTRALSRDRLAALAAALGDGELAALADSDVYWDEVVSVEPLGLKQVYDLTVPGTHNFVANDVCVHNTAFTLNIAQHAAIEESKCVAFFSLEMSKDSLVQRLLTSEARVDAGRVRTGRLRDDDYPRLAQAAGLLNTAPIYIDDTPGISILEMRAKARRLKSDRDDLSMIIVDYLQLMTGNGKTENRQQEVSEISRGLKALAKELEVPVVALSQLSRAVESRPDKRPMMSDLRECVTGDTIVWLADGRRVPIRDLVGTTPEVHTVTEAGRLATAASDLVWSVGRKPVFSVRLASGRRIRATAEHRLRGPSGWVHVSEIAPGDRLALARRVPEPAQPVEWPDLRVALLGHLVGDGSYLSGQPLRYTTASEENSAIVTEAARAEFGAQVNRHAGRGNWHQLVLSGNGDRWHPAGVNLWLRELGIFNQRSHQKRLPADVFRFSDRQVALLLRHLWATDGTVHARRPGSRGSSSIFFSTCSRTLADDVAALLLRLGMVARIREQEQKVGKPVFTVSVSGSEDQRRFVEVIGGFGPRAEQVKQFRRMLDGKIANTNVDTLPREVFDLVRGRMMERGVTHRAMANARGTSYGGTSHFRFAPSRAVVADYATLLEDDTLREWAGSDLFWDRVVEVVAEGEEEVFDLTVPGPACWLADGIVSHNSGAIEQDADVIMFLFRPEYYHGPTDKDGNSLEGLAEVIIGKQRNGATGTVQLAFRKEFTRFENFTRRSDEYGGG
ncbi:replicative DNA helicase [Longimicrobium sp.]|uniref:replicative DNA helicase n=1 Tax=Longimicrobium sp. TaxID=2029185 RepID=UPI002E37E061|nr:replicative DNA helicase [Longimicrobium sp.]HEX6042740.1 replicative DNA helicase [Longimicrobium sp.]